MRKFSVWVVILLSIVSIIFGKMVRYTIMYDSLVVPGGGWHMIEYMNTRDTKFIINGIKSDNSSNESVASLNTIFIISKLNFLGIAKTYYDYEWLVSIIWNAILIFFIIKMKKSYSLSETLFLLMTVSVLNIFDFCFSKEPIQMIYFIIQYLIIISKMQEKNKYICCGLVFILCFLTYRNYYMLMAGFMCLIILLYRIILKKDKKLIKNNVMIILFSIFFFYFFTLNIIRFFDLNAFNELIRVRLRISSAASDMRGIFQSQNLIIFTLDYLIMILRMMLPIELLKLGSKYYIYIIYQCIITVVVFKNLKNINKLSAERRIALIMFMAFVMGSAAFEPDFGSWIRHEAVVSPILFILFGLRQETDNKKVLL